MKIRKKEKALIAIFVLLSFANVTFAQWTTSGNNIYNSNTANVGVGTTNPSEKLHVDAGNIFVNGESRGFIVDAGGSKRVGLMKYSGMEGALTHGNTSVLRFGQVNQANVTGGTFSLQMVIDNNGNVGIGTYAPASILHVLTTATSGNGFYMDANTVTTGVGLIIPANGLTMGSGIKITTNGLTTGNAVDINSTSNSGTGSASSKMLNISRSGTNASHTAYGIYSTITNTGTTSTNIGGYFSTSGATNNYALIVPASGGNVGIGTTAPGALLQVKNAVNGTLGLSVRSSGSSNSAVSIEHLTSSDWQYALSVYVDRDQTKAFAVNRAGTGTELFVVYGNGVVNAKKLYAEEVQVTPSAIGTYWPDYVFAKNYKLMPLLEVEKYLNTNNHLPDVPSEQEVNKNGIGLGEMSATLLKKVEELTLYSIQLEKKITELQKKVNAQ